MSDLESRPQIEYPRGATPEERQIIDLLASFHLEMSKRNPDPMTLSSEQGRLLNTVSGSWGVREVSTDRLDPILLTREEIGELPERIELAYTHRTD